MTCKKATYLLSKKEERALSWIEKWQLYSHMAICGLCRKFEKQTNWLIAKTREVQEEDYILSEEVKRRMEEGLGIRN